MVTNEQTEHRLSEVTDVVRSLVETMRSNGLARIDVEVGDVVIRLRAGNVREVKVASKTSVDHQVALPVIAELAPVGHVVTAPMIGTYYTSAAPGEPPFVRPGDRVDAGQTIGIIEAMKIMNEIVADRSGVVAEVIAANAQAVEYGSPLLRIIPDEAGG
jgi:acetyl-CoA carboxylase biotin carboxyl carrier protein